MIPARGWIVVIAAALLIIAMGRARAADDFTCPDVQATLATVRSQTGMTERDAVKFLEAMARSGGATEEQIKRAKACLPSSSR